MALDDRITAPGASAADAELARRVRDALRAAHPHVTVTVDGGAVVLAGSVHDEEERRAAAFAAGSVEGVRSVALALEVEDADAALARRCEGALRARFAHDIRVTARRGWIELDGVVDSPAQRSRSEAIVWFLPGVEGVVNRLESRGRA